MWDYVSTQSCVEPTTEVPTVSCVKDNDCFDGNSCSLDMCQPETGQCINTMLSSCCGNGICEEGESDCRADCGPFTLHATECITCTTPFGIMFDVTAKKDIVIEELAFRHYKGDAAVTIYTTLGTHYDRSEIPEVWTKIANDRYNVIEIGYFKIKVDPVEVKEGEVRAFYIASTERILVGHDSDAARPSDENIIVSSIGRGLVVEQFGYGVSGFNW